MSQPSVSRIISELEKDIGVLLLTRNLEGIEFQLKRHDISFHNQPLGGGSLALGDV